VIRTVQSPEREQAGCRGHPCYGKRARFRGPSRSARAICVFHDRDDALRETDAFFRKCGKVVVLSTVGEILD
jgi:hypothetical protein